MAKKQARVVKAFWESEKAAKEVENIDAINIKEKYFFYVKKDVGRVNQCGKCLRFGHNKYVCTEKNEICCAAI